MFMAMVPLLQAQPVFEQCLTNGGTLNGAAPVVETITVPDSGIVNDVQVQVQITHTFQGDIELDLSSPNATVVALHDGDGGASDNLNLIYSDTGVPNGSDDFNCGCVMQPAVGTMVSMVNGSYIGDWTLTADDNFPGADNGTLDSWCLSLFEETPPVPIQGLFCFSAPGSGIADVTWENPLTYDSINVYIGGSLVTTLAGTATNFSSDVFPTPSQIQVGIEAVLDGNATATISCDVTLPEPGATIGPDVTYQDCTSVTQFTSSGDVRAYALGSFTCNRGPENLAWGSTSPLLGMNAYRLENGRLVQIGLSFVKNGTIAAAGSGGCGTCNGNGGSVLGSGCRDIYGSGFNGGHGVLGPRSDVNAFTGAYPGPSGPSGVTDERLQVKEPDLMAPMAQYFVEGVYVAFDDAAAGNAHNNASYKAVNIDPVSLDMTPTGSMAEGIPCIQAWADHGLGAGVPDASVEVFTVDVPSEGRFHVAMKVTDLGNGSWLYDYAVFNLNSHRSGGSFSIPLNGANASNVGFHDVDYHSGEPYDLTDWSVDISATAITWSSPETFTQNANSNAYSAANQNPYAHTITNTDRTSSQY